MKSNSIFPVFGLFKLKVISTLIFVVAAGFCISAILQVGFVLTTITIILYFLIIGVLIWSLINLVLILFHFNLDKKTLFTNEQISWDYNCIPKVAILIDLQNEDSFAQVSLTLESISHIKYSSFQIITLSSNPSKKLLELLQNNNCISFENINSRNSYLTDNSFDYGLRLQVGQQVKNNILKIALPYIIDNKCNALQLSISPKTNYNTTFITKAIFGCNIMAINLWNVIFDKIGLRFDIGNSGYIFELNSIPFSAKTTKYLPARLIISDNLSDQNFFGINYIMGWSKLDLGIFLIGMLVYLKTGSLDNFFVILVLILVFLINFYRYNFVCKDLKIAILSDYISTYNSIIFILQKTLKIFSSNSKSRSFQITDQISLFKIIFALFVTILGGIFLFMQDFRSLGTVNSLVPFAQLIFLICGNIIYIILQIQKHSNPTHEKEITSLNTKLNSLTHNHRFNQKEQLHIIKKSNKF